VSDLLIAPTPTFARDLMSRRIVEYGTGLGRPLEILEAGCGRKWNIDLAGLDYRLTGIDLDADALAHREKVVGDLHVAVVGDLRTVDMPRESYDVVFSAFVLEHISGAQAVLDSMVGAVRPGGLLVLRIPDGEAVFAFLARLLPFWTHVLFKRIADRDPLAGKPGHAPYRVVYDGIVYRKNLLDYVRDNRLELLDEFGTNPYLNKLGRLAPVGRFLQQSMARMSFGRLAGTHCNLTMIIRKPAARD
jgi:SAM-dependent methyltransferase